MKKNNLLRKVVSLVVVSAIALSFAACAKKEEAAPPAAEPAATEEPAAAPTGGKVIIGLDDNFPPMGFRDEKGELTGYDIDLAKEAATRMGVEAVFQPIDWSSKELELSSKKIDLLWNGLTITDDRKKVMLFTDPYISNRQIIMVKKDSPIKAKADLKDKIIGLQKESSAVSAVEADTATRATIKEVSEYGDNISAFLDLEIGRVDAVVVDEIVARYYITQNKPDFVILEENFGDEDYGVAGRLDDTELMGNLQKALNDMKADGKMEEITNKWFGDTK